MPTLPYTPPPQLAAPVNVLVYLNKDWKEEWAASWSFGIKK